MQYYYAHFPDVARGRKRLNNLLMHPPLVLSWTAYNGESELSTHTHCSSFLTVDTMQAAAALVSHHKGLLPVTVTYNKPLSLMSLSSENFISATGKWTGASGKYLWKGSAYYPDLIILHRICALDSLTVPKINTAVMCQISEIYKKKTIFQKNNRFTLAHLYVLVFPLPAPGSHDLLLVSVVGLVLEMTNKLTT